MCDESSKLPLSTTTGWTFKMRFVGQLNVLHSCRMMSKRYWPVFTSSFSHAHTLCIVHCNISTANSIVAFLCRMLRWFRRSAFCRILQRCAELRTIIQELVLRGERNNWLPLLFVGSTENPKDELVLNVTTSDQEQLNAWQVWTACECVFLYWVRLLPWYDYQTNRIKNFRFSLTHYFIIFWTYSAVARASPRNHVHLCH